ncbi:VWA domain-containing protein [bacterium]|nr:VWA domain-containing protein [bacterium]
MRFADPQALWLLALLPLLAWLRGRSGPAPAVTFPSVEIARRVARELAPSHRGGLATALRLGALGLLVVALARPQQGLGTADVEASGIDIVLAIDVSGSMAALDFQADGKSTSRLDAVKKVVEDFVADRPNDRLGLVAFAGRPYLVSPLTLDHDWLTSGLERLRIGLVEDGTAIGSGIASSVNRLRDRNARSRVVILLTDGVNNAGKVSPLTAADAARALGVRVYTIAAGTRGEAPMPVTDRFGRQRVVMTPVDVDEDTLRKVAETTGAQFFRATDTDSLRRIYEEIDRLEKTEETMKHFEEYRDLFPWAILGALALLGIETWRTGGARRSLP